MKIICIGRNYAAHAKELNNDIPEEPVIFMKPKTALLIGNDFYYPEFTKDIHYECELVVKIAKNGKHIQEKFARKYYKEMTVGIDFTARDLQQKQKDKGLPWEIAKAFDNSAVVGKFIPIDEDSNLNDIDFELKLNNATVQNGNTNAMIFNIDKIIAYISQFFTLHTGDLIFTGTPPGVGSIRINDTLEGFLMKQKLFEVKIK